MELIYYQFTIKEGTVKRLAPVQGTIQRAKEKKKTNYENKYNDEAQQTKKKVQNRYLKSITKLFKSSTTNGCQFSANQWKVGFKHAQSKNIVLH